MTCTPQSVTLCPAHPPPLLSQEAAVPVGSTQNAPTSMSAPSSTHCASRVHDLAPTLPAAPSTPARVDLAQARPCTRLRSKKGLEPPPGPIDGLPVRCTYLICPFTLVCRQGDRPLIMSQLSPPRFTSTSAEVLLFHNHSDPSVAITSVPSRQARGIQALLCRLTPPVNPLAHHTASRHQAPVGQISPQL